MHWIFIGSVFGALSVILGAFGAHALKGLVSPSDLGIFETGVRYQMYHAIALLVVGLLARERKLRFLDLAGWCFCGGILIFSGSLYLLVLLDQRWLGAVTPIGGLAFILGWASLAVGAFPRCSAAGDKATI